MRCYVIGNGKSLTATDLNKIIGQHSIACNRINLIYPETAWRPTIYIHPESLAPDIPFIKENVDMGIECFIGEHFAEPPRGSMGMKEAENIYWLKDCHHHLCRIDSPERPDEWHFPQLCSFGGSVNIAMQIAVKKGYDEIVLLGCDLGYKDKKQNHFHPDYEHGGEQPSTDANLNALHGHIQALNWIRRTHSNVKVYNATRGGFLELWERIELE